MAIIDLFWIPCISQASFKPPRDKADQVTLLKILKFQRSIHFLLSKYAFESFVREIGW